MVTARGVDIAANDAVVDLGHGDGMIEAVFASLERAASELTKQIEAEPVANDAVPLQLLGNGLGSGAGRDVDEGLGMGAEGGVNDIAGDGCGDENEQKQKPEKLQNCVPPSGPARCIGLSIFYDHGISAKNTDKPLNMCCYPCFSVFIRGRFQGCQRVLLVLASYNQVFTTSRCRGKMCEQASRIRKAPCQNK